MKMMWKEIALTLTIIETKHCLITTQPANTRNLLTIQVYHIAQSQGWG